MKEKKINQSNRYSLTEGPTLRAILHFALPILIGQIFQLFYGLVDVRVVGEILGETSLAAVGATSTLSDLLVGFLNGFTNGLAIIIATYFGA
ncbi:MAG: MATE family efflux transporter, partial [Lachnospiraceae bacterium]|nr:MATE family efflux transporter [Lachnospiraceae bacterium]